jgi:hypothetical protein
MADGEKAFIVVSAMPSVSIRIFSGGMSGWGCS